MGGDIRMQYQLVQSKQEMISWICVQELHGTSMLWIISNPSWR
ncbi:MAG: hypothetical protein ACJ0O0_04650 [Flavobacteriaceae bacterium]